MNPEQPKTYTVLVPIFFYDKQKTASFDGQHNRVRANAIYCKSTNPIQVVNLADEDRHRKFRTLAARAGQGIIDRATWTYFILSQNLL